MTGPICGRRDAMLRSISRRTGLVLNETHRSAYERASERRYDAETVSNVWVCPDASVLGGRDPRIMTVLVVYASRHGATAEIAARIAARLVESGAAVDLHRVSDVQMLDVYDAVVFGAPVYDQSWPPEADRFVDVHRDALA